MEVNIKEFDIPLEVKSRGIEFEVRSPNGKDHLGDLVLTNTKLIWCPGRVSRKNGHTLEWTEFIELAEEHGTKGS